VIDMPPLPSGAADVCLNDLAEFVFAVAIATAITLGLESALKQFDLIRRDRRT